MPTQEAIICQYLTRAQDKIKVDSPLYNAYRLVIFDVAARGLEKLEVSKHES